MQESLTSQAQVTPQEMASYFDRLWPLLRSLTGEGIRRSHDILGELLPLERFEIPSGTRVFDWTVPKEWVVREAYVVTPGGGRILDVKENNLHLLNYSVPFRGTLTREALDAHLYSLPEKPDAIPYVTSYYAPRWGFCLEHRRRLDLPEGLYEVVVDTAHIDGSLTLGEAVLPGATQHEVLLSTYTCHPSLANNELSGPLVTAFLYRRLAALENRRLTYRFVFVPETIGSLCYLSLRGEHLQRWLEAGYVVTCVGDDGPLTYKRSRMGDTLADRAAEHVLARRGEPASFVEFSPARGSDERQYASPGFNLPVGSLTRTMYGNYPEYHTSLDNRDLISFEAMCDTVEVYYQVLATLDKNRTYRRTLPYGEPQLGRHGLFPTLGTPDKEASLSAMLWLLNFSDGAHDLLTIAKRSGYDVDTLSAAAQRCLEAGLITEVSA